MIGWLAPDPTQPGMGLSAQADPDYYTRKKVNGVWITGKFRRTSLIKKAVQVASASSMDVTATNSVPATLPVLPSMVGLVFPSSMSLGQTTEFPHDSDDARREALVRQAVLVEHKKVAACCQHKGSGAAIAHLGPMLGTRLDQEAHRLRGEALAWE
jgi:hypothetical protein